MANLLDSLFFQVGWDTRDFDSGRKKVEKGFHDTKESSRSVANDIEASGKKAASFFRSLRNETVGLFLAFQGASSFKGFVSDLVTGIVKTDILSKNIGMARNETIAWQNAIKGLGGTAQDANNALTIMNDAIQSKRIFGNSGFEARLQGLGVTKYTNPEDMLLQISDKVKGMDREQAAFRLKGFGFSPEVIDLLVRGRGEVEKLVAEQRKHANVTDDEVEKARKFQQLWADIGATLREKILPVIMELVDGINGILTSFKSFENATPLLVGALGAVAIATAAATWEWVLLAGAIAGVIATWKEWERLQKLSPEQRQQESSRNSSLWGKLFSGDIYGALTGSGTPMAGGGPSSGGGGSGGGAVGNAPAGVAGQYNVLLAKYGKPVADAIWRGIGAESNWNPNASLTDSTGRTYGLGQWRGKRLKNLMAKYGDKNGRVSAADQIKFLMWELEGGDGGGRSVLNSSSYGEALSNYIGLSDGPRSFGFMRPSAAGRAGDLRRAGASIPRVVPNGGGGASSSTTIGTIIIHTAATDATGIAKDLPTKLRDRGVVLQANSGVSQ